MPPAGSPARLREMCYRKLYLTFCYTMDQYTLYLKVT
jgi:hypothetical protein